LTKARDCGGRGAKVICENFDPRVKGQIVSITARKKRKLSAAAIAHIRAAQKAHWATWRKAQKKG
jgi:hypothetical protein